MAYAEPDETVTISGGIGGHGGADTLMIAEFLRFAAEGGPTRTSPIAARQAVAAALLATDSIRGDNSCLPIPELDPDLIQYYEDGQA
jgi:hypothetical protein